MSWNRSLEPGSSVNSASADLVSVDVMTRGAVALGALSSNYAVIADFFSFFKLEACFFLRTLVSLDGFVLELALKCATAGRGVVRGADALRL